MAKELVFGGCYKVNINDFETTLDRMICDVDLDVSFLRTSLEICVYRSGGVCKPNVYFCFISSIQLGSFEST